VTGRKEGHVKIRLLMLVERDPEGQLTGVIFQEGQFRPGCFSGTPELVKAMEEVLPPERPLVESARGIGSGTGPGSALEPTGG
jgi:hypothetical protein